MAWSRLDDSTLISSQLPRANSTAAAAVKTSASRNLIGITPPRGRP